MRPRDKDLNPFAAPHAVEEVPTPRAIMAIEHPEEIQRVQLGLLMVYVAICGSLVLPLCVAVWNVLFARNIPTNERVLAITTVCTGLGLYVLHLTGLGFCTLTPMRSRPKGFALAALVLQTAALFVLIGIIAYSAFPFVRIAPPEIIYPAGYLFAFLFTVSWAVCFVLYMRDFAIGLARFDVAARARVALITGLLSVALAVVGFACVVFDAQFAEQPRLGFLAILGLGGLGMLISAAMYANTVIYLRKAIDEALNA